MIILKIQKIKIQNLRLNFYIWNPKWSQTKKFINYKVLDLIELYDCVFIQLHLKKIWFFWATAIFKDCWLSQLPLKIDY